MILIALMYVSFFLAQRASNVCACKHPFKKCRLPIDHLPCVLFLRRPLALLGRFSSLQHDFSLARSFLADAFLVWNFVAAWRRIVAAFVSFVCWRLLLYVWCKECFPECMYATIFLLLVISVPQVEHLLSPTILFLENLFGVIARYRFFLIVFGVKFCAHWRRTVAAFVSLCVQDCCRMYVKSFIAQLRSDLLPAACRDFRPSRTSAIACCIQWKSVWIDCAIVSCWSFLMWSFLHIGVVSWPHLSVSVLNIAVVCL
jgi:hypothetical protein